MEKNLVMEIIIDNRIVSRTGPSATSVDIRWVSQVHVITTENRPKGVAPNSESLGDRPAYSVAQAPAPLLPRPSGLSARAKAGIGGHNDQPPNRPINPRTSIRRRG